jgi:polyisoprenoid-binding protein YceI
MALKLKRWHKWTMVGVLVPVVAIVAFLIYWQLTNKADDKASEDFDALVEDVATSTTVASSVSTAADAVTSGPPASSGSPVTTATPDAPSATTGLSGTWTAIVPTADEQENFYVGYRVDEVLFGQDVTVTGRTRDVTGSMTIDGDQVTAAEFVAQMATVVTGESRRDNQFSGRIMAVDEFPTATFTLTGPIALTTVDPADGEVLTFPTVGDLTVRGTTKSVTLDIKAFKSGDRITVTGEIPIVFSEWGIPEPSFGPATVEGNGLIEFLLTFERQA